MKKVLVLCFCVMLLLCGCTTQETILENTVDPSISPSSVPVTSTSIEPTETPGSIDAMPVLDGLEIVDITLSLEEAGGIPRGQAQRTSDGYEAQSTFTDLTGDDYTYLIYANNERIVSSATFSIFNYSGSENFLETAGRYLGYCATVPYDDAMPDEARAWVLDNIEKALDGEVLEEQFGTGLYMLSGTEFVLELQITADGREEWLSNKWLSNDLQPTPTVENATITDAQWEQIFQACSTVLTTNHEYIESADISFGDDGDIFVFVHFNVDTKTAQTKDLQSEAINIAKTLNAGVLYFDSAVKDSSDDYLGGTFDSRNLSVSFTDSSFNDVGTFIWMASSQTWFSL